MLRRNVLIFHSGALGDFVLNWPLAMALGRIFAQSRIIYVTAGQKGKLAEKVLRIDAADVENGWHHLFSTDAKPPENVLKLLSGAHAVYSFVAEEDSTWAANVRRIAPEAKLVFAKQNPAADFRGHVSEHLLASLESDKVVGTAVSQMLRSIAQRGTGLAPPISGPVVLHPGAGSPGKRWPREQFMALSDNLRSDGRQVQVVIGEVELETWPAADLDSLGKPIKTATLLELFEVLSKASAVVANDSGPAHLAGIIGVPTVCLFGATDPAVWKPLGPRVSALRADPMKNISVEQVLALL